MIVIIAIIIIGTIMRIGHTGATCKSTIETTARTTSSELGNRGTTGDGATSIPTAKRDAMTGAKKDRRAVKGGEGRCIAASSPLLPLNFSNVVQQQHGCAINLRTNPFNYLHDNWHLSYESYITGKY